MNRFLPTRPLLSTLGWAAFLAGSWTWCIGMFLPVLMVRDFGFLGWVVFALPNVIGAAAMGWVLARPGAARRIVEQHAIACQAFSAVTVAFHCFFVAWLVRGLLGWGGVALAAEAVAACYAISRRGGRERALAAVVLGLSLGAFAWAIATHGLSIQVFEPALRGGPRLLYLAPAIVFGFALCPYLDLTFLRARAMTESRAGIAAFTLGFGVFFLLMILFTLWYSRWLLPEQLERIPRVLAWVIGGHLAVQTGLTVALHARPLFAADAVRPLRLGAIAAWALAFALPLLWKTEPHGLTTHAAVNGERVYRLFMGFYGLIFPAYVWLCMIPVRGAAGGLTRRSLAVYALAVTVAGPMFYLAFIANHMIWVVPGIAAVLAGRLLLRGR